MDRYHGSSATDRDDKSEQNSHEHSGAYRELDQQPLCELPSKIGTVQDGPGGILYRELHKHIPRLFRILMPFPILRSSKYQTEINPPAKYWLLGLSFWRVPVNQAHFRRPLIWVMTSALHNDPLIIFVSDYFASRWTNAKSMCKY